MFNLFFRLATIIILFAQFNVYSQDVKIEYKPLDNSSSPFTIFFGVLNPIEYYSTLFSEKLEQKDSEKVKLPGVYKEFTPGYETTLILLEKEFNISYDNDIYSLVLDNRFDYQSMFKINNEFLENKIIRKFNKQEGYEVNIPQKLLKKGTNKISLMVICHSEKGIMDGDINIQSNNEKINLNGIWDYYVFDKYKGNINFSPTQGFDLLNYADDDIEKYTSFFLKDKNWPKTNFPVDLQNLFVDKDFNGAVCFRKRIQFKTLPNEDYVLKTQKGIDDYDRLYVNEKLVGTTDCWSCPRKYIIPKNYLKKENIFTFIIVDKHGSGGVNSRMTLSNTKETIDISDQWSYEKMFDLQLLLTVKKIDNNRSFFSKSNISFFSLLGSKINFDDLLIKDNSESKFYFSILIFFILSFILVIYFIQKRRLKVDGYKQKKDVEEQKYLFIRADRANHKVLLDEITLIEGKKDYVKVTVQDKSYFVRKNLKTFLKDLPASKFVRISKSLALNIEQIKKIDKNMLFVKSGEYFIIGKKYSQEIKELLNK